MSSPHGGRSTESTMSRQAARLLPTTFSFVVQRSTSHQPMLHSVWLGECWHARGITQLRLPNGAKAILKSVHHYANTDPPKMFSQRQTVRRLRVSAWLLLLAAKQCQWQELWLQMASFFSRKGRRKSLQRLRRSCVVSEFGSESSTVTNLALER
eukprot:3595779-Amphidinium_carterae.1